MLFSHKVPKETHLECPKIKENDIMLPLTEVVESRGCRTSGITLEELFRCAKETQNSLKKRKTGLV